MHKITTAQGGTTILTTLNTWSHVASYIIIKQNYRCEFFTCVVDAFCPYGQQVVVTNLKGSSYWMKFDFYITPILPSLSSTPNMKLQLSKCELLRFVFSAVVKTLFR